MVIVDAAVGPPTPSVACPGPPSDDANVDIAELYVVLAGRLRQIVRLDVRAPDQLIDDACQVAWSRLVVHRDRVQRETALAWLATTAIREAIRLVHRERREVSLEELIERAGEPAPARSSPVEELVEQRDRLRALQPLPERQRRLVWLQGLGLSYTEMARYTGASSRTVERQLLRARRALRSS